jgi:hypothetical protein
MTSPATENLVGSGYLQSSRIPPSKTLFVFVEMDIRHHTPHKPESLLTSPDGNRQFWLFVFYYTTAFDTA